MGIRYWNRSVCDDVILGAFFVSVSFGGDTVVLGVSLGLGHLDVVGSFAVLTTPSHLR